MSGQAGAARRRSDMQSGQTGMPDEIRTTVEGSEAHPQPEARTRASFVVAAVLSLLPYASASAEPTSGPFAASTLDAYVAAFGLLDRQDIAALALTLSILCFAVVTAILLVRTRRRLADVE